jgi:hypothetical protein
MATKNLVPRTAGEGKLGISTKKWEEVFAITGSFGLVSGSIVGQRPITTHITNFTASMVHAGHYNIVGGNLTCSILHPNTASVDIGTEFEFFQTSSAGTMLFETGSTGATVLMSKDGAVTITGQYSGASLKKVATDTWQLVGDLA